MELAFKGEAASRSCCSAYRCGRRWWQLVPIWRTDAGMGKVSHQTLFKFIPSFCLPLLIMQQSQQAPALCSALLIISDCSGGQGSREGRRERSHLLLPAAHTRRPAELTAPWRGGALRASILVQGLCMNTGNSCLSLDFVSGFPVLSSCMHMCACTDACAHMCYTYEGRVNVGHLS